tara:strand:+ start:1179 stop:1403 length:225 start_codon:yes stop_codon:yes gene_type:complete
MAQFWEATVQFEIDNGNGKVKKMKEYYLVAADSASYAEAQVNQILKGETDFTVISTKQSKINTVRIVDVDGKDI